MKTISNRHDLYINAYLNSANTLSANPDDTTLIKRLVFYGVRIVNSKPKSKYVTREETIRDFKFAEIIKELIGKLTSSEFENIFPITKDYDGDRNQNKDYFYTKDFLRTLPADKAISDVIDVSKFLWEYSNWEITFFIINTFEYMDRLLMLEGKPTMMETLCHDNGINLYYMYTDDKGKQYIVDPKTGQSSKVRKPKPRYLRLVRKTVS